MRLIVSTYNHHCSAPFSEPLGLVLHHQSLLGPGEPDIVMESISLIDRQSKRVMASFSSIDSFRQSSPRQGETVLPVRHQQAIGASHPLPVIFVGSSTNETDLIVLAIATESWPRKPMGAKFSEESLQESHVCLSLPQQARLGGGTCSEECRVN
jgi:hypothetical protein